MLDVVSRTLSNGLKVLVLRLPQVHSVTEALMVRAGPRYERPEENGLSHLVEHLLFRGTRSHPSSLDFHVAVETLGGEINGLTQRDATTIQLTVPPRAALEGLGLLAEVCIEPLLTGLDVERDVVIEEILDTVDANGHERDIDTLSRGVLWAGHPLGQSVAGDVDLVGSFTEAQCRAHFARIFVAQNAVLCVAGPVDPETVFSHAERCFGPMPSGARLPEVAAPEPTLRAPIHVYPTDDSQVSVVLTFPAPHENHPDFAKLLLLRRILDDGFGSRLRQAICEQSGIAYSMGATIDVYGDAAALDLELTASPRKLVRAVEVILQTVEALMGAQPVEAAELARVKTRHAADLEFALDDPSELCGWHGGSELVSCPVSYEARQTEVLAVSSLDLQRLARNLFERERAFLTLVGPVTQKEVNRLEQLLLRRPQSTRWFYAEEDEDLAKAS